MYFNEKKDTVIDKGMNKKSFKDIFNKYKLLFIIGLSLIIVTIIFLLIFTRRKYYIDLNGEEYIKIYKGSEYIEDANGYYAYDSKGNNLTNEVEVTNNIDNNTIGEYTVTYKLHNVTKERYISVIEKPNIATYIHLKGDEVIYLSINEEYIDPGYTAIDTVDSNLTKKVKVTNNIDNTKAGIYKVTYSVTNSSGVTSSAVRKVIVMDSEVSLSLSNTNPTNSSLSINIHIIDNYYSYLILPNNNKITSKDYSYKISSNGEYKFTIYNTKGKSVTKSISVTNIDKEEPNGSCSGYIEDGKSYITVNATDNLGVSYYISNGVTNNGNVITLESVVTTPTVTIYDKAGNTKNITCTLEKRENFSSVNTSSSSKPSYFTDGSLKNIVYEYSSNTLHYIITKTSRSGDRTSYYTSYIWVKDAYNQMKTAVPQNFGKVLKTPAKLLQETVSTHNYQSIGIIAVNGSGFVLKDKFGKKLYNANHAWNNSSQSPIVIVEGKVLRDFATNVIPANKIVYGLKRDGYLEYYQYTTGTNTQENINVSNKIISDGVQNTFAFSPVLVYNGKLMKTTTEKYTRQGFCQIDKNTFVFITDVYKVPKTTGFSYKELGQYMISLGCITGFNLDGGGSVGLVAKKNTSSIKTFTGSGREIADIVYFHE